jgi:predicted small lipoprotein YifL
MRQMILRRGLAIFLILGLLAGLAACGKKSALEPPPGDRDRQFPATYPSK